ncbi:cold shock domain-containing protein [Paraburkholderia xenovorans]|uniref:cold shock domain-containing protein n=1 Tax=Paraburkholderia xenovorans TaxID=36873 RepID=UPI0038BC3DA2
MRLITSYDGGEDLVAHFSEVQAKGFKSLQENQKVSFDVSKARRVSRRPNIQLVWHRRALAVA